MTSGLVPAQGHNTGHITTTEAEISTHIKGLRVRPSDEVQWYTTGPPPLERSQMQWGAKV